MKTLKDKIYHYLNYSPTNLVYRDSFFLEQLKKEYGKKAVQEELKRQEGR